MPRPRLEVADILRDFGPAWRRANAGHVSLQQMKVMSAITRCRTAALGGHVARCEPCGHTQIAYNSCRNRHSYKDYRSQGSERYKAMTLETGEFIRRFLMHVLPKRFHRIRHYGLLANGNRAANIRLARELLGQQPAAETPSETPEDEPSEDPEAPPKSALPCPHCGGPMVVIEVFQAGCQPKHCPTQIPIARALHPAISCLGASRTPANSMPHLQSHNGVRENCT